MNRGFVTCVLARKHAPRNARPVRQRDNASEPPGKEATNEKRPRYGASWASALSGGIVQGRRARGWSPPHGSYFFPNSP
jgi:hypothetical protein